MRIAKYLLLSCVCTCSFLLQAQEGVYIGGFYESVITDSKKINSRDFDYLDKGDGPGIEIGALFTPVWGARIEWAEQDYNRGSSLAGGSNGRRLGVDLMYRFTEKNHLYALAGLKSLTPGDGHAAFNLGLGASLPFASRWAFFAEGVAYQGIKTDFTDYGIKGGLRYKLYISDTDFIHPHKPVQTAIISYPEPDSDKDGVVDRLDLCPDTPTKDLVNEHGCTIIEQILASININIIFPNDSSHIDPIYYPKIKEVADFMERNPETEVEIAGHTSTPGSEAYNLKLSSARAKAVANVLINEFNINPARVKSKGYGESRLLDLNNDEQAHATNRRIEAVIYALDTRVIKR